MLELDGIPMFIDNNLVVDDGFETVRRTLKERLFQRPWNPIKSTKIINKYKPDPTIYKSYFGFTMHPLIYDKLKKEIDKRNKEG